MLFAVRAHSYDAHGKLPKSGTLFSIEPSPEDEDLFVHVRVGRLQIGDTQIWNARIAAPRYVRGHRQNSTVIVDEVLDPGQKPVPPSVVDAIATYYERLAISLATASIQRHAAG